MSNDKIAATFHPCTHHVMIYNAHDSIWRCVSCGAPTGYAEIVTEDRPGF